MNENTKTEIRELMDVYKCKASFLEDKENGVRNGLIRIDVKHDSNTLPNEAIKKMLEKGYTVSCVCGGWEENPEISVYFEPLKGTF